MRRLALAVSIFDCSQHHNQRSTLIARESSSPVPLWRVSQAGQSLLPAMRDYPPEPYGFCSFRVSGDADESRGGEGVDFRGSGEHIFI